ncbi:MAG: hypothetical protein ACFBSC_00400 [Microcoleaceae cyanobacterium]
MHQLIITPEKKLSSPRTIFWLALSLFFSILYGLLVLQQAFDGEYVVQDDARKHIFWMRRWLNPELFQQDLISDFFQSIQPIGLKAVYGGFAQLGVDPMLTNRCFPLLIGMVMSIYCFCICFELFPLPIAGFITTLLLNQSFWMRDTITAAVASSFAYPLFFGFLYYWLNQSYSLCLLFLTLEGLFYPPVTLLSLGLLVIDFIWDCLGKSANTKADLTNLKSWFYIMGLGITVVLLLGYQFSASDYGPVIRGFEARNLPEFQIGGRAEFYSPNLIRFRLLGTRSGMVPRGLFSPITLCSGLLFPIFIFCRRKLLLLYQTKILEFLIKLLTVSITLFLIAHQALFHLFLPSRYTSYSFYLIIAITSGITITSMIDQFFQRGINQLSKLSQALPSRLQTVNVAIFQSLFCFSSIIVITAALILYPITLDKFTAPNYVRPREFFLYEHLAQYPKDTLIASLSEEADNIPTFAQLPILVGWEYALPYQTQYYQQIRERSLALIQAQYSSNPNVLKDFINRYQVDLFLVDLDAFTPEFFTRNDWFRQRHDIAARIQPNANQSALLKLADRCAVYQSSRFVVIQSKCVVEQLEKKYFQ